MAHVSPSPPPGPSVTPPRGGAPSTFRLVLVSLRPEQWTKNLLVLAGVAFGGRLRNPHAVLLAFGAFALFCGLSGAVYLFNDAADRETDRNHPLKCKRPIASGELSSATAVAVGTLISIVAIAAAFSIGPQLALVAAVYLVTLVLYSLALKHIVILDALTIAAGFVLRAIAGAVAVEVPIGHWLLVCTTLLALFLALSKRRHELVLLADGATGHRRILEEYSPYLLDQMIGVVTASTLIAYTIYATSPDTATRLGTTKLGLTIPFVLYGIFRYLYLVHQKRGGGSPAAMLLNDWPLLGCVALWAVSVIILLYTPLGK